MNFPFLKSILIVDDDEISNLFHKIFIGKLGITVEVDVALNGKEAINFLQATDEDGSSALLLPCMLFLDIRMPTMDGWEFLEVYEKQVDKHIRDQITIVMLTTSEDEVDRIKAVNNPNIKEFIQKPLSESKFKNLIDLYYATGELN